MVLSPILYLASWQLLDKIIIDQHNFTPSRSSNFNSMLNFADDITFYGIVNCYKDTLFVEVMRKQFPRRRRSNMKKKKDALL